MTTNNDSGKPSNIELFDRLMPIANTQCPEIARALVMEGFTPMAATAFAHFFSCVCRDFPNPNKNTGVVPIDKRARFPAKRFITECENAHEIVYRLRRAIDHVHISEHPYKFAEHLSIFENEVEERVFQLHAAANPNGEQNYFQKGAWERVGAIFSEAMIKVSAVALGAIIFGVIGYTIWKNIFTK